jgi:hypothetical protein
MIAAAEIEGGGVADPSIVSFRYTEEAAEADRELEQLYPPEPREPERQAPPLIDGRTQRQSPTRPSVVTTVQGTV